MRRFSSTVLLYFKLFISVFSPLFCDCHSDIDYKVLLVEKLEMNSVQVSERQVTLIMMGCDLIIQPLPPFVPHSG